MERDVFQILDALLDGVVVLDAVGRVEHLNAEACRILDTSPAASAGAPVENLRGGEHFAKSVGETLGRGVPLVAHELRIGSDRQPLVVDVACAPLYARDGAVDGAVMLLRDQTVGLALREATEEREQDALFGRIAAGIAHEVKNPLGGIRGAAELLAGRSLDPRSQRSAELILREADRITALVDDFLSLAHGPRLQLGLANLHEILDDVLQVLELDCRSLQIERVYDPSLPEFCADANRLRQVFLNLGRNAIEASDPDAAELQISTRLRLDHRLDFGDRERAPSVVVEWADRGCGIPAAERRHVLTPFFTTKPSGTGLGLALCRHFVSLHGGSLQILGREGGGTAVQIALPLRREP